MLDATPQTNKMVPEKAHGHDVVADPISIIEKASHQNIWACYQCGKCTADCPFSLTPNMVVRLVQLGEIQKAKDLATTWECATCYTCQTQCPKGVSPALLIKALRNWAGVDAPRTIRERIVDFMKAVRARMLAQMPFMFRIMSRFSTFSNLALKIPGSRLLAHYFVGIHKNRPMPLLAAQTFPAWFASHTPVGDGHRGKVLLFHDTFMDFNYPFIGKALTELLEKVGYQVELTGGGCCGRPAISKGVQDIAEKCARNNIPELFKQVDGQNTYIVGAEPSCLLTLRDEYLHLAPELSEKARVVAERTFLIDEFLSQILEKAELKVKWKPAEGRKPVLFHGHCHQKAFAHPDKSLDLLRAAGYAAEMVNAACCGMAGAYGFEKEHYEPSRAAGERSLFPILRSYPDHDVVLMGVSCRQQIEHFMGRPVRHLVEALRDAAE